MKHDKLYELLQEEKGFDTYDSYLECLFAVVNVSLLYYIEKLKKVFATEKGDFKNVLYPDIEIAGDQCEKNLSELLEGIKGASESEKTSFIDEQSDIPEELMLLFSEYSQSTGMYEETEETNHKPNMTICEMIAAVMRRADTAVRDQISIPLHQLCKRLNYSEFTLFSIGASILSATQTSYAGVFQIVNQNGSLSAPTIESAAKLFYSDQYSVATAYAQMSLCLEKLLPIFDLRVNQSMPFTTVISPDKRMIDFLFGEDSLKLDKNYTRFFKMLTDQNELDPIMANAGQLEALEISYREGVRIFSLFGDEGSGRKFFIKNFCRATKQSAVVINCKKLFVYDFSFVEKALWAVGRECIFTESLCCLDDLSFREDEKEKFIGYMDLAAAKLREQGILVFLLSRDKLPLKEVTREDFTELELLTPSNQEREDLWRYYATSYDLDEDVELSEMATKFLFTPGKIKAALYLSRSFATMNKEDHISRATLFQGCYNQMSSELTQKATKVKANFGFEDIVMNSNQRETLQHAIDQMNFRKQVYDNWNYTKKYPYGRGLSILLFGAPGTGKSMCAQVIAHELNLELYRVDLSKVIDKYVGETEKSISMIFREAKKCNVVLFFDECDTLFAKRSDDGGSNQSSNNNKTALLLQEVEAYDGVSVLATNYKHNIDPAFFRRMKYIVEFQFPDPDTREMLWRTTIPKGTPLGADVDIRFLAEKFEFVGGNIKNCILNAAFLAAADGDGKEVCMKHYLQAIRYEFVKTGKVFTRSDFEPYASLVGL